MVLHSDASPLWGAALNGDFDKLREYIAEGADLEERFGMGDQTALHRICSYRKIRNISLEAIDILLKAGADVHAKTGFNSPALTPMHYAARGDDTALMELLVKHGAVIDGRDGSGHTPLRNAAREGNLAAVKWLVSKGADFTIKDNCKQPKTARQVALACKHAEVAAYLKELEARAKVSSASSKRSVGSSSKQPAKKKKVEQSVD